MYFISCVVLLYNFFSLNNSVHILLTIKITTLRKKANNKIIFTGQIECIRNNNWLNFQEIGSIDPEKSIPKTTISNNNNNCYTPGHWIVQRLDRIYRYSPCSFNKMPQSIDSNNSRIVTRKLPNIFCIKKSPDNAVNMPSRIILLKHRVSQGSNKGQSYRFKHNRNVTATGESVVYLNKRGPRRASVAPHSINLSDGPGWKCVLHNVTKHNWGDYVSVNQIEIHLKKKEKDITPIMRLRSSSLTIHWRCSCLRYNFKNSRNHGRQADSPSYCKRRRTLRTDACCLANEPIS